MALIQERILKLKREKRVLLLAHYYEDGEIQEIADFVGDSYQLALRAQQSSEPFVLMAGVVFMAESIKILNPSKKVIVPDLNASCSLVIGSPVDSYRKWIQGYLDPFVITYINSSAEIKAISDVIVTSSNAEKIVRMAPEGRPILFGPDRNLGRYLMQKTGRRLELWPGVCQVHIQFSAERLLELKKQNPDAKVLAHPECDELVLQIADVIGSTSKLLQEVINSSQKKFIVATEDGIFHQMKKFRPDAILIQAPSLGESCQCNRCPYMKLNTLDKIEMALKSLEPEVSVSDSVAEKAKRALERMVHWTEIGA